MKFVVLFFDDLSDEQKELNGIYEPYDKGWYLVDTTTNLVVGRDGGAPEDQLLIRNWRWVKDALNAEAARAEKAEAALREFKDRCDQHASDLVNDIIEKHGVRL